jgi:hypothetical protein
MFGLPDNYTIRARIFPSILAVAPAIALALVMVSWRKLGVSHAVATAALAVLLFAFSDVARRRGKRLENGLFEEMGGKPTTTMLRFQDATLEPATKARWVRFLAGKIGEKAPDADLEAQDPAAADGFYERCGNWLREHTRDLKRFKLVFEENVTYGFRRNLLGLKWPGLWLNGIVVVICVVALWFRFPFSADDDVAQRLYYVLSVALLHATFFLIAVNRQSIKEAANQYARQLLLACESLDTGGPLKKAPRPKR